MRSARLARTAAGTDVPAHEGNQQKSHHPNGKNITQGKQTCKTLSRSGKKAKNFSESATPSSPVP
jgi:hypothetical protein